MEGPIPVSEALKTNCQAEIENKVDTRQKLAPRGDPRPVRNVATKTVSARLDNGKDKGNKIE